MCLWKRTDRLPEVIAQLSQQEGGKPVRLILWNNDAAFRRKYEQATKGIVLTGSLSSVELFTSRINVGGIARFIVAHRLVVGGYRGPFITLDDDQNVSGTFLRDMLRASGPNKIAGWWAFRNSSGYWDRTEAADGEDCTYVGTGGAIFDSALVRDRSFFTRLPARYGFLEDTWASHVALTRGWALKKVDTPIEFVLAEHDQGHVLAGLKEEFYQYLSRRTSSTKHHVIRQSR